MLERDGERARLARSQGNRRGSEQPPGLAQDDLVERIAKFDGDFHLGDDAASRVDHLTGKHGYFLMDKIFGAAHGETAQQDVRCIGLLGPAKGQLRIARAVAARGGGEKVEKEHDEKNQRGGSHQSDAEPTAFLA